LSEEKFSLNGDPRLNYINLILNDMKNFNNWYSQQRNIFQTGRALRVLLLDLPPAGQEYMKTEKNDLVEWEHSKLVLVGGYQAIGQAYQKAIAWIWPNILQDFFKAKPKNPQPTTLGE